MILPEPLVHILHIDDGIVHEGTDGDAHSSQSHRVDVHSEQLQHDHCGKKRDRDGNHGDKGGPETAQEEEQDEDNEYGALQQSPCDIVDRRLDVVSLTEHSGVHHDILRKGLRYRLEVLLDCGSDLEGVDVRLFADRQQNRFLPVHRGMTHLHGCSYTNRCHIRDDYRVPAFHLHQ